MQTHGFTPNIRNGQITISSNNGSYISGDLAVALGIETQQKTYVSSTNQTSSTPITYESISSTTTEVIDYTTITTSTTTTNTVLVTTLTSITNTSTIRETTQVQTTTITTTETINTIYLVQTETLLVPETSNFIVSITSRDTGSMKTIDDLINGVTTGKQEYSLSTKEDLLALANYVNSGNDTTGITFVLGADIDLASISNWTPIGNYALDSSYIFAGTFDGNGHVIKNLTIDNASVSYQGLFGRTAKKSVIKNLGIEGGSISGNGAVGVLVGMSYSTISNCYTTGDVVAAAGSAGGLVGDMYEGSINNCYATGDVNAIGSAVGGLVGSSYTNCPTKSCYATGTVSGDSQVGGLIGHTYSSISHSYATGCVTGKEKQVGGLVGLAQEASLYATSINHCYATGDVTITGFEVDSVSSVGGLAGSVSSDSVNNCYATGNVISSGGYVGGLIGLTNSVINNCYAVGTVSGTGYNSKYIGGLVGSTYSAIINNCYATGVVSGKKIGGLTGELDDTTSVTITNSASVQSDANATLMSKDEIKSMYTSTLMGFTSANGWATIDGFDEPLLKYQREAKPVVYTSATPNTTLSELGVSVYTTIELPNVTVTVTSMKTIEDFIEEIKNDSDVVNAELIDGVLLITTLNVSLDLTSGFLVSYSPTQSSNTETNIITTTETVMVDKVTEIPITETIWTTTTSETTKTETTYHTTTSSQTRTETLFSTATLTATGSTTFGEMGAGGFNVNVFTDGALSTLNIGSNLSIADFLTQLSFKGITATESGGIVTLNGVGDSYVSSSVLSNLFNLGALNKTTATKTVNTKSDEQRCTVNILDRLGGSIYAPGEINLQVGINAQESSQLKVQTAFQLTDYDEMRRIGTDDVNRLDKIDKMLATLSARQTEFGAVQNRLISILDEIAIQQDNLVSALSTIRDADMAEISSQYIQQQILQQASATLLATANQTPALALQLL